MPLVRKNFMSRDTQPNQSLTYLTDIFLTGFCSEIKETHHQKTAAMDLNFLGAPTTSDAPAAAGSLPCPARRRGLGATVRRVAGDGKGTEGDGGSCPSVRMEADLRLRPLP